jgi:hypothetical protein
VDEEVSPGAGGVVGGVDVEHKWSSVAVGTGCVSLFRPDGLGGDVVGFEFWRAAVEV